MYLLNETSVDLRRKHTQANDQSHQKSSLYDRLTQTGIVEILLRHPFRPIPTAGFEHSKRQLTIKGSPEKPTQKSLILPK